MRIFVTERRVAHRLTSPEGPWIGNIPRDFRIVDCRLDSARGGIVFIIRSKKFSRVARGAQIPEGTPGYADEHLKFLWGE
jgi:hypothetical protein